jgi:hypothetical protein
MPTPSIGDHHKERIMSRYDSQRRQELSEADLARRVKAATAALVVFVLILIAAGPAADVEEAASAQAPTATDAAGAAAPGDRTAARGSDVARFALVRASGATATVTPSR